VVGDPRIAFTSDREGKLAIYVMDPDGSNVERVSEVNSGTDETHYLFPSWSPDGQRVAYWGTEGNYLRKDDIVAGVWVAAADGSERVRVNYDVSNVFAVPPPVSAAASHGSRSAPQGSPPGPGTGRPRQSR